MEAERPPLLAWGLGTLHAALLMLVLVFLLYRGGGLGELLGGLGTLPGLALFAWLWVLSCVGARMALRHVPLEAPPRRLVPDALAHGLLWGGAVGVAFFAGLTLVTTVVAVAHGGAGLLMASVAFSVLGLGFAGLVGFVVGAAFAALDVGLLLAARWLSRD
jgi:hypothetical protein